MVYCDHFALRNIAADEAMSAQFVAALRAGGGTLAVSWLNFGEHATVTDRKQCLQAERLLDRILPFIFPIDATPFTVATRQLAGQRLPHADLEIATWFVRRRELTITATGVDRWLSASGLFEPMNHPSLVEQKDWLARLLLDALNHLRREYATSPHFKKLVRAPEQARTNLDAILRALVATLFPDARRVLTLNDAIDLLHATVPTTFCDAVVLDGATCDAVERA